MREYLNPTEVLSKSTEKRPYMISDRGVFLLASIFDKLGEDWTYDNPTNEQLDLIKASYSELVYSLGEPMDLSQKFSYARFISTAQIIRISEPAAADMVNIYDNGGMFFSPGVWELVPGTYELTINQIWVPSSVDYSVQFAWYIDGVQSIVGNQAVRVGDYQTTSYSRVFNTYANSICEMRWRLFSTTLTSITPLGTASLSNVTVKKLGQ